MKCYARLKIELLKELKVIRSLFDVDTLKGVNHKFTQYQSNFVVYALKFNKLNRKIRFQFHQHRNCVYGTNTIQISV